MHCSILAWKILWTEEPGGLQSTGSQRVGHDWACTNHPDTRKDWGQEEKGVTEDEMVGWHHRLNGHEFEQSLGDGEGQGNLVFCSPLGHKEMDMTLQLNNDNYRAWIGIVYVSIWFPDAVWETDTFSVCLMDPELWQSKKKPFVFASVIFLSIIS